jgi:triosephosphate isomerase
MSATHATEVALCPPFVYLTVVGGLISGSNIALGAQNVSSEKPGAFTGEIAAPMLADVGCKYVIVGHSERRTLYGETNQLVARKVQAARLSGLTPIICVGETLPDRESNRTEDVVGEQIDGILAEAGLVAVTESVIAYEPVWAIGTGRTASPDQANAVHAFIRARVSRHSKAAGMGLRIIYGGSVKGANAAALFAMPEIDGGLIGGASLNGEEFLQIYQAAG